jgi:hypothetical protein
MYFGDRVDGEQVADGRQFGVLLELADVGEWHLLGVLVESLLGTLPS